MKKGQQRPFPLTSPFLLMPRLSRIGMSERPHHITQRGNYRQNIFEHYEGYAQRR
jgi:hypothetical protein